jgi:hypothetical protein
MGDFQVAMTGGFWVAIRDKELSDPKHPVNIAMEKMKTVPEVRIIEGFDK